MFAGIKLLLKIYQVNKKKNILRQHYNYLCRMISGISCLSFIINQRLAKYTNSSSPNSAAKEICLMH